MTITHESLSTQQTSQNHRSMSTWDLVEQLKASYGDGESFDASVVFELANRALEAETPNSTARPEGKYTTDTF